MPVDHAELTQVFSEKYDNADSDWAGGSGPGSDPFYTLSYRSFLESFIRLNHIGSIVDIGCGDWQFSRYLDLNGVDYLGLDVVPSLIKRNQAKYGDARTRFSLMPSDYEEVPPAHLLIVKDVLQHLPNNDILRFRDQIFPKFAFCLITNSYRKLDVPFNVDTAPGGFRCLDLRAEPFRFKGGYVLQFSTGVWEELRTLLYAP